MILSKAEKVKVFCYENKMSIQVYDNKRDWNQRTVLFDADLFKNGKKYQLFISLDYGIYRIEVKFQKTVNRFKTIEDCLNWIKSN